MVTFSMPPECKVYMNSFLAFRVLVLCAILPSTCACVKDAEIHTRYRPPGKVTINEIGELSGLLSLYFAFEFQVPTRLQSLMFYHSVTMVLYRDTYQAHLGTYTYGIYNLQKLDSR